MRIRFDAILDSMPMCRLILIRFVLQLEHKTFLVVLSTTSLVCLNSSSRSSLVTSRCVHRLLSIDLTFCQLLRAFQLWLRWLTPVPFETIAINLVKVLSFASPLKFLAVSLHQHNSTSKFHRCQKSDQFQIVIYQVRNQAHCFKNYGLIFVRILSRLKPSFNIQNSV